jgi:hypothetical protein
MFYEILVHESFWYVSSDCTSAWLDWDKMDTENEVLFHTLLVDVFPVMSSIDTFYHKRCT